MKKIVPLSVRNSRQNHTAREVKGTLKAEFFFFFLNKKHVILTSTVQLVLHRVSPNPVFWGPSAAVSAPPRKRFPPSCELAWWKAFASSLP